jgi:polyisoprenyl-phosphate glycosyltransferase
LKNIILIPVYNDWKSLNLLLSQINDQINYIGSVQILIVNDASTQKPIFNKKNFNKIKEIKVLNLNKNVGSQKAICIGLDYLSKIKSTYYVTIMDGDGEDNPNELSKMLILANKYKNSVVVSSRLKRNENLIIKLGYKLHLIIAFIFTWKWISFGNFSTFHSKILKKINYNEIYLAYSSGILKNFKIVKSFAVRQERYFGTSKVSLIKLIEHSMRVISVYQTRVMINSFLILLFLFFLKIEIFFLILPFIIFFFTLVIFIRSKNKPKNKIKSADFIKSINSY